MNINQILVTVSQKARVQGLLNVLDEASPIVQGFVNLSQEEVAGILATFVPGIEPMKKLQAAAAASPAQLGDMLACAGSLLIYGIPEDGGRISPN